MKIKDRVESSPVVFLLGALVGGFLAGVGSYEAVLRIAKLEIVRQGPAFVSPDSQLSSAPCDAMDQSEEERRLLSHLLAALASFSAAELRPVIEPQPCEATLANFPARAELLAYLTSGEDEFRDKAVSAYARCAEGVDSAYFLARTIKNRELPNSAEAYANALFVIVHRYSKPGYELESGLESMEEYLVTVEAPAELVRSFAGKIQGRTNQ